MSAKKQVPLEQLVVLIPPGTSIHDCILKMAEKRVPGQIAGMAVVADKDRKVVGVLTDGDVRRAYARGVDFKGPVDPILVKDPITVPEGTPEGDLLPLLTNRVRASGRLQSIVRNALILDRSGRLTGVLDVTELLVRLNYRSQKVAVHGMGHVGVTLAVTLANLGHTVVGIEKNDSIASELAAGKTRIFEPGLSDMLALVTRSGRLSVIPRLEARECGVHIVAVGSPVDENGIADSTALLEVSKHLSKLLKPGDLVMLRSTVPVGFTRTKYIPALEEGSGLVAGQDFFVAFAPERTIEGKAMTELRTLPQIVGGYTEACSDRAANFWSGITHTVVRTGSLEGAEIVKIANNTFRDLSFAFANELALLCDSFNADAFRVIGAANEGYPRNTIPLPSPGVGGYCLTKDPLLYGQPWSPNGFKPELGRHGRKANELAKMYPIEVLGRWAKKEGMNLSKLRVLILGIAFKGVPENADTRGSTSVELARELTGKVGALSVWDAVIQKDALSALKLSPASDPSKAIAEADAIFVLNNHPTHALLGIPRALALEAGKRKRFLFDGWHQLDSRELEQIEGITYATMGYWSGGNT